MVAADFTNKFFVHHGKISFAMHLYPPILSPDWTFCKNQF